MPSNFRVFCCRTRLIFRRELGAFLSSRILLMMYFFHVVGISMLMTLVFRQVLPALKLQPSLVKQLASRQVTTLLVGFALLNVLQLIQATTVKEKRNQLLDTLLTTPLTLNELVWGKALHLGLLGNVSGFLLGAINLGIMCWLLGSTQPFRSIPLTYYAFAFLVAPGMIVSLVAVVTLMSFLVKDPRIVAIPTGLFAAALITIGSLNYPDTVQGMIVIILVLLASAFHIIWWRLSSSLRVEDVLSQ